MKKITLDTKSNRYFDENGYLVIKDNKIAKAGVFEYLGREISDSLKDTEIYKVYRPWEELEKSAKDFEGMPVKLGHEWIDPSKRDVKIGAVSGEVKLEEPYLIADIKIYDKGAIEEITAKGIVDLSPGYSAKYTAEGGEYNGEKYDFKQEDIKYNHLAVVENGRSGKDVKISDNKPDELGIKNIGDNNMKKHLGRDALGILSYVKKTYDECITSKTDDTDKRELIREIVAIAVKPDTDFEGGEEEKFKTILKKAEALGYEPNWAGNSEAVPRPNHPMLQGQATQKCDSAPLEQEEKTVDSDVAAMKEAFNSFASLFNNFLSEEEREPAHTEDDDEVEEQEKGTGGAAARVSDGSIHYDQAFFKKSKDGFFNKNVMDAEINKAILNERKRTQDAIAAYQEVEKCTGSFNMAGMTDEEIYQYAYNVLTGEKVKVSDAKPSFKAYIKAKVQDSSINMNYANTADDFFNHIK